MQCGPPPPYAKTTPATGITSRPGNTSPISASASASVAAPDTGTITALVTEESPNFGPSIASGVDTLVHAIEAEYDAGDFSVASYTGSVHWYRSDFELPRSHASAHQSRPSPRDESTPWSWGCSSKRKFRTIWKSFGTSRRLSWLCWERKRSPPS